MAGGRELSGAAPGRPDGPPDGTPDEPEPFAAFHLARSERIYDSSWVGLRRDVVLLPSGAEQEYHVVEISDAVVVVPVRSDGSIVMIGQYRYPHGRTHWEVPAGRLHADEDPADGARRELLEETGHRAGRLVPLPGFYPVNGISAHWSHAFCALDCEPVAEPATDDAEQIVVRSFARDAVERLLDAGRIADAFSALALAYYLRRPGS